MARPRKRAAVAVVIAVLLLLTGCSSSTGEAVPGDFAERLADEQAGYELALDGVRERGRQAVGSGGEQAVLSVYTEMLEVTRSARDDYARLQPPHDLQADHDRLVELLTEQAAVLERVLSAVADQDDDGLAASLQELAVLIGEWATANAALSRALTSTA